MKKEVVVSGINGFVGEHVAREFKKREFSVIGVGHDEAANEKVSGLIDSYISCDLLDEDQVNDRLSFRKAAGIIHLAGLANVGESFDQPTRYMTENGIMAHHILAKALFDEMPGRAVVISTGALYDPRQPLPLDESSQTASNSPYAVGKLMSEDVARYYRTRGVNVVIARPFNHIGPGQSPGFILPDLYEQLLSAGETETIEVGNLETKRDYTDVRDIARAYASLALAATVGYDVYNICSGKSISGGEILSILQRLTHKEDVNVVVDRNKLRPNDIEDIRGDSTRIHQEHGWAPEIPIEQTIQDFITSRTKDR